jgi:hypothetical protein
MSVVMGYDTSLTITGVAQVDLGVGAFDQLEPLRWMWGRPANRVEDDGSVLARRRRIRAMLAETLALTPERFDLAVVEGPAMAHGKQRNASGLADERAGFRWMLIDQLLARGPVVLVPPSVRASLATDNGSAGKPAVHEGARRLFPAAQIPKTGAGRFDVADAVVLAAAGAHALGMPWPGVLSTKQISAHAKVAWPVETAA